jgi:integrase
VNDLLNDVFDCKIEFEGKKYGGQVAADHLLARMRACFNWYATQDDKFVSPIVRGMARTNPRERARSRVLTDEEIRALWPLLPAFDTFGGIVQMLLMTAQRRDEVAAMARSEISSGVWTLPASRYKTKRTQVVPLSKAAQAVVTSQNQIDNSDLVFTTTGKTAFSGFSKLKSRLDAAMLTKLRQAAAERGDDATKVTLPDWRLHDLRRTAKTLMARAGVRPDISERVLGHVIAGIEGVYDRYGYVEEKRAALEALAALLHRIVNPSTHNVVALREAAQ